MFNNHVRLILSKMVIWHRCPYLYMCIQFTTLKKLFYQYIVIHDSVHIVLGFSISIMDNTLTIRKFFF